MLNPYLAKCPLIAILRGVTPEQCLAVADILIEAGFTTIEIPLNSPDALTSIRLLSERYGKRALIGAGTVTQVEQVQQVQEVGGELIFSPNCDVDVIKLTKALGLVSIPGCATPSEAFAALGAGADMLKLFPAEMLTPTIVKSLSAVLPKQSQMIAVGGISADNMAAYMAAGCVGFGYGGSLYKPGKSLVDIKVSAEKLLQAFAVAKGVENEK